MVNNQVLHPIALVEQLMAYALNKVPLKTGEIKAIKVTKRGIYTYSTLSYNKANCLPIIGDETIVYTDSDAAIPFDEITQYVSLRPRVKMIKYKGESGLRILHNESASTPCTERNESETKFDSALYIYFRELYKSDSKAGKELKTHFTFRPDDFEKLDAKLFLLEYQFKSLSDRIAFTLYESGYREGFYDNFTGILYGSQVNGEQIPLTTLFETSTEGVRILSYSALGIRIEETSVITKTGVSKARRSIRYRLPDIDINTTIVDHFKTLKTTRKGIVLTNNVLPEDLINTIYYYNALIKEEPQEVEEGENSEEDIHINSTQPIDILTLEREMYSSFNPFLLIEPIRERTNNEVQDIEAIDERIKREALVVGYSVVIVRGIQNVTEEVIRAADVGLVYVIDDFLSISDVQHKLESVKVSSSLIMSKVIGIMDLRRVTYFKMNQTMREIITDLDICGNSIMTTSFIKVDDEYKNFNSCIFDFLKDEAIERLLISSNCLTVVSTEGIEYINTEISFNNMISFLAGLSEVNIYKQLLTTPIVSRQLHIEETGTNFKLSSYMEDDKIIIVIKKLSDTILEEEFLPKIEVIHNHFVKGKNVHYVLSGEGTNSINTVAGSLVGRYLEEGLRVLLIDQDYSINEHSYSREHRRNLEVLHTVDKQAIYDIVNSRKPTAVVLHKVKDAESIQIMYTIASLVPNICITSKFTTYFDILMNFIHDNVSQEQYEYYTNTHYHVANSKNHFEKICREGKSNVIGL